MYKGAYITRIIFCNRKLKLYSIYLMDSPDYPELRDKPYILDKKIILSRSLQKIRSFAKNITGIFDIFTITKRM